MRRLRPLYVFLAGSLLAGGFGLVSILPADEGQWLPEQIAGFDFPALRARGLELSADQIWDGESGLLSAAVKINGCSASFVSPDGLVVTNHHCGYAAINAVSTTEHNHLADGFVAASRAAELRAPGYRVSVVRRIEDVSAEIHAAADQAGKDPAARWLAVQRRVNGLVEDGEKEPDTSVIVTSYFKGREWRRIYRTELRDVRLVYAPPEAVGAFGGEVDNWEWPRHTGDFSFFRAYVAPDGSPADYAPDNVPYRPERWLEVSTEGVADQDLVMILGYPGRTERYLSSAAVAAREAFYFPRRLDFYTRIIDVLEAAGSGDAAVRLQLASRIKSLANRQKNAEGMVWGLARNAVVDRKRGEEREFLDWVGAEAGRRAKYGHVLDVLLELDMEDARNQEFDFVLDELGRQSPLLATTLRLGRLGRELRVPDLERAAGYRERDLASIRGGVRGMQRSFVPQVEVEVLALLFGEAEQLPARRRIKGYDSWKSAAPAGAREPRGLAEWAVRGTRLGNEADRLELFDAVAGRRPLGWEPDPMLMLASALLDDLETQRTRRDRMSGQRMETEALWVEAQQAWRGGRFYPDANGTLRVSVAEVGGYAPRDGVAYTPHTTTAGLLAKNTGVEPFVVPAPLLQALRSRDFGSWLPAGMNSIPVCMLTNGDTTGGNSGSPVVDGKGRLVGLNFDRVFENVSGDYGWNQERSRNISVDVRYVLWLMDKVWPAHDLLREMGVYPSAE
ncbi:MAG TPA: S46 family peptidase [Planctomycetota bacterium]